MAIIRTHFPEVKGQAGRIIEKQLTVPYSRPLGFPGQQELATFLIAKPATPYWTGGMSLLSYEAPRVSDSLSL